jgi:ribosomal protein S18 acetylase RimI-like enzyme
MVKAKELKVLRKRLEQLIKSNINPLEAIQQQQHQNGLNSLLQTNKNDSAISISDSLIITKFSTVQVSGPEASMFQIVTSKKSGSVTKPRFLVHYYQSLKDHPLIFQQCLHLFTENMKELYEKSSWGYDMASKQEEFLHLNARFIVLIESDIQDSPVVAAFVHFRYCYNDDDNPSEIVLYVYELQVRSSCQKQGIGQYCMQILELIAQNENGKASLKVSKIMLTVFRSNESAMEFYVQKMHYQIDHFSPSCHNQVTDYEILSKKLQV